MNNYEPNNYDNQDSMINILTLEQQSEVLEVLWFIVQNLEEMVLKSLKTKKPKSKILVTNIYDFLNKVNYTKCRPAWEATDIKEDPRQMKLFQN
jgi:hypothetical protein